MIQMSFDPSIFRAKTVSQWKGAFIAGLLAIACFWLLWAYFHLLRFDLLQSDPLGYWQASTEWQHPFDAFHPPVYPLAIALARAATLGLLPPLALMIGITFAGFLISATLVYRLLRDAGIETRYAALGMLLFCLWPFTGLVYTVFPYADMLAITLFLAGLYALQHSRLLAAGLLLGLCITTHKVMWPFVGLVVIAALLGTPRRLSWRFFTTLVLPVGLLWLLGFVYSGSATWLFASTLNQEATSNRSTVFVFDGITHSIFNSKASSKAGIGAGVLKSIAVAMMAAVSVVLMFISFRSKTPQSRFGLAISCAVLLLCLFLSPLNIWAAMRFSKLLVLPLMWALYEWRPQLLQQTRLWAALILLSLATQFAYAWYMAKVFFS